MLRKFLLSLVAVLVGVAEPSFAEETNSCEKPEHWSGVEFELQTPIEGTLQIDELDSVFLASLPEDQPRYVFALFGPFRLNGETGPITPVFICDLISPSSFDLGAYKVKCPENEADQLRIFTKEKEYFADEALQVLVWENLCLQKLRVGFYCKYAEVLPDLQIKVPRGTSVFYQTIDDPFNPRVDRRNPLICSTKFTYENRGERLWLPERER